MANHKSAIKRHRQSLKRRDNNRSKRSAIRTASKAVVSKLSAGDLETARSEMRTTERLIAKAASKGVLHRKTAARKISRLAKRVAAAAKANK